MLNLIQSMVVIATIKKIQANHMCNQHGGITDYNPISTAKEACFGTLADSMTSDFTVTYDRLPLGQQTHGFVANGAVIGGVYPVRSPQVWTRINQKDEWGYKCFGDVGTGCYGSSYWNSASYNAALFYTTGTEMWCQGGGGSLNFPWSTNYNTAGQPLLWQCYCKFGDDFCQFDSYVETSGFNSLQNKITDPTVQASGALLTYQDNAFTALLTITVKMKMEYGVAFTARVTVCGAETVSVTAGVIGSTYTLSTPVTFTAATQATWFSQTFPSFYTDCTLKTSELVTDNSGSCSSTTFTHSQIALTTVPGSIYKDITITTTSSIQTTVFWLKVISRGLVANCKKFQIEVCGTGNEVINLLKTPEPYIKKYINEGGGTVTPYTDIISWFSVSVSTACIISNTGYRVQSESGGVYTDSTTHSIVLNGANQELRIRTSSTTHFLEYWYVTAKTIGNVEARIRFQLVICGSEVIALTNVTPNPPYYYYLKNIGNQVAQADVSTWFAIDSMPYCSIANYKLEILSGGSYVANNVPTVSLVSTTQLRVSTTTAIDYTVYVTATSDGGVVQRRSVHLKVCGDEILGTTGTGFESHTPLDKDSSDWKWDIRNLFTNNFPLECPIIFAYQLTQPSSPFNPISSPSVALRYPFVIFNTIYPGQYDFCIQARTATPITACYKLSMFVCGNEVVNNLQASTPFNFYQTDSGTFIHSQASTYLISSDTRCPVVRYEMLDIYEKPFLSDQVTVGSSSGEVRIKTLSNMNQTLIVRAYTKANNYNQATFWIQICGKEQVLPFTKELLVYDAGQPLQLRQLRSLQELLYSSHSTCPVVSFQLAEKRLGANIPYSGGQAYIEDSKGQLIFIAATPGLHKFYLLGKSTGSVIGEQPITFEICGYEKVFAKKGIIETIVKKYAQKSGPYQTQTINYETYVSLIDVNSNFCLINKNLTNLFNITSSKIEPLSIDSQVRIDNTSKRLYINTTVPGLLNFWIGIKTNMSEYFYIPVQIAITPVDQINKWNLPPYFQDPKSQQVEYLMNDFHEIYKIRWNITKPIDDWNQLRDIEFLSYSFGRTKYVYDISKQIPVRQHADSLNQLDFNYETNVFTLSLYGPERLAYFGFQIHEIIVIITDMDGLSSSKKLILKLAYDQQWYANWLASKKHLFDDQLKINQVPVLRIDSISVFGEVNITFNSSSPYRPDPSVSKSKQLLESKLKIYVAPSDEWQNSRNQDLSSLNFTWKVQDYTQNKLSIKLDFFKPTSVSPYIKYDKLVMFADNLQQIFKINLSSKRMLTHSKDEIFVTKPIQRQMKDTVLERKLLNRFYQWRAILEVFFIFTFLISIAFRRPWDRMFKMVLELQLIVNLANIRVTLPGNAMYASQVFKPFVGFRIMKKINGYDHSYQETRFLLEDRLEEFGQRYTLGYDTVDLRFNLSFLLWIIIAFTSYVLIIYIISKCSRRFSNNKNTIRYFKQWSDKLIYNDFLQVFIAFFLEFAIASLLTFEDRDFLKKQSLLNSIGSVLFLTMSVLLIPILFKRQNEVPKLEKCERVQKIYSSTLLGFKPDFTKKSKFFGENRNLMKIVGYIFIRYAFVIIVFGVRKGWLQLMLFIWVLQAGICVQANNYPPMHGKWNSILHLLNQCVVMGCLYILLTFTDWIDHEQQYTNGYALIIFVFSFVSINLAVVVQELIYILVLLINFQVPIIQSFRDWWGVMVGQFDSCKQGVRELGMQGKVWLSKIIKSRHFMPDEEPESSESETVPPIIEEPKPVEEPTELRCVRGIWVKVAANATKQLENQATAKKEWQKIVQLPISQPHQPSTPNSEIQAKTYKNKQQSLQINTEKALIKTADGTLVEGFRVDSGSNLKKSKWHQRVNRLPTVNEDSESSQIDYDLK